MLLDFFARTHTPYLHARGAAGTALLAEAMAPKAGERILELGFGAGHTLALLAGTVPGAAWFGLERSATMLATTRRRLRWCGLRNVSVQQYDGLLPFPDHFFDAVFCESVLAIVPGDQLPGLVAELYRVLRPGGRFYCNESIWRPHVGADTIRAINEQCLRAFGLVQATERFPYPADWRVLFESAGFTWVSTQSLEQIPAPAKLPWHTTRLLSTVFSRWGWLKARLSPALRRQNKAWRRQERQFGVYGKYLEGALWVFQKAFTGPE